MKKIINGLIASKILAKPFIYATGIALLCSACGNSQKAENTTETVDEHLVVLSKEQLQNAKLGLGKLTQTSISDLLKVNGKIDVPPQNMVSISVPLGGYLKESKLLPGMHISKGEIIAVMQDQQYIQLQQDYLTSKAQLSYIQNEYIRQKELNASKASSDKVFQQAEADFITHKVLVKALSEKLKLIGINPDNLNENNISKSINIYSPINGYVSKVNVNIGKYTQPSEVLFELVNPSDIHLALTIFEKDLAKIAVGQKLYAYTNSQPNKKHPCEIILVGQNLDEDRSAEIHCHFNDYDKNLLPGMYMNAEIEIKNNKALVLPNEAIVRDENKLYLFAQSSDTTFEMVEVKVGATENNNTEILQADHLIDKMIVVKNAYTLLMKSKNKMEEE